MLRLKFGFYIAIVLAAMLIQPISQAQAPIILQAHIPTQFNRIPDDAIAAFEEQFGVELIFHEDDTMLYLPSPTNNLNEYLDALANYVQSADVLLVHSGIVNPIGTKTAYLLNLAPLIYADIDINPDNYAQAVWETYQWDGGFWALPASFDTVQTVYNPSAFDAANLSYPDSSWGFDDYIFAIEQLTQRDANGVVTQAGYENGYDAYFFLSAPNDINSYQLWQKLNEEVNIVPIEGSICCQVQTMSILPSSFLTNSSLQIAPLPNNVIGIEASGFAVSAGTAHPDLAYELAKFLSQQEAVLQNIGQSYPARNSLLDIPNILNFPELLFVAYALSNQLSLDMALVDNERARQTAEERQNQPIAVTVPATYGEGIHLRFGVQTYIVPMPNQSLWDDAATVFAEQDDEVGAVIVEPDFSASLEETSNNYDCFLRQTSDINSVDSSLLLAISPLLAQDASFDPHDLAGKLWEEMQASGEIYGYPLTIMPRYLAVDSQVLSNAGLTIRQDWSITEFTAVLEELDTVGYEIHDALDLMTLLAAYGALPTQGDSSFLESSAALAEVLRLLDAGLISYNGLLNISGMGTPSVSPIRPAVLSMDIASDFAGFQLVNYPGGLDYTIASYRLGVFYISRNTPNPYACYRWLRYLSQHPEIFQSIPSHISQMNERFQTYNTLLNQPNLVVLPWIGMAGNTDNFALQYFFSEASDKIFLNAMEINTALSAAQAKADAYQACRNAGQAPLDCATGLLPVESVWR